ncbi:tetratricopeptide repeat protein [Kitasatospora sp. NPDC001309]|uniref:tetratricopeptide repeat protein n=1 Tax=Kitasatospora sp. NPDC001309 TaxID=3364013 RepID=UPI0036757BF9
MSKSDLAIQARLGRTTVSAAFLPGPKPPSEPTVRAIIRVLRLSEGEKERALDLWREASGQAGLTMSVTGRPGRPIDQHDPHDLEVHPAGTGAPGSRPPLSGYVARAHDAVLAETARDAGTGRSRLVMLVGASSTGKTRACWEAVQPLAEQGWWLWHPYDPTRAEAALADLDRVGPRTVVWLNEAQHYLGDPHHGERVAAALHSLLTAPGRGPILVLGTLWPEYADTYSKLPKPGRPDPHTRVRELLGGRTLAVPDTFEPTALRDAGTLASAGDALLFDALQRAGGHGRLAQELAGAPELLRRYESAAPPVRALLEAAMDARRLGVGLHLPRTFLTDAALDYLTDHEYDRLTDNWAEAAYADVARTVHGHQAPLHRVNPRPQRSAPGPGVPGTPPGGPALRLADYLEQHGRDRRRGLCPPASFWHAASTHLTRPDDLMHLARAAEARWRLRWADQLLERAADTGDSSALSHRGRLRETAGDLEGADECYRRAVDAGDISALLHLGRLREKAGDAEGADECYRRAADAGDISTLLHLGWLREKAGDPDGAGEYYQRVAGTGNPTVLVALARVLERAGDVALAESYFRQAAATSDSFALLQLAQGREWAGDIERAERYYRRAADAGNVSSLINLAELLEKAGDPDGAREYYQRAADTGDPSVLVELGEVLERAGDVAWAEECYQQAAKNDDLAALFRLAEMQEEAGDPQGAREYYQRAADAGDSSALVRLGQLLEEVGDVVGAEQYYQRASDTGGCFTLLDLGELWEERGNVLGARDCYRRAADTGLAGGSENLRRWPFGLEADGSPSGPWREQM